MFYVDHRRWWWEASSSSSSSERDRQWWVWRYQSEGWRIHQTRAESTRSYVWWTACWTTGQCTMSVCLCLS